MDQATNKIMTTDAIADVAEDKVGASARDSGTGVY